MTHSQNDAPPSDALSNLRSDIADLLRRAEEDPRLASQLMVAFDAIRSVIVELNVLHKMLGGERV
jgi:hypothetical protein